MPSGVQRLAAFLALAAAAALAQAAPLPTARIGGIDYVPLPAVAAALSMREGSSLTGRHTSLSDRAHRVELEAESYEMFVDGLRVYLGDPALPRGGRLYVSLTDVERCLLPILRPDLIGQVPRPPRVIAIDPGHGGTDRGTENPQLGLMEKTFTLQTAFRLRRILESQGFRVVMTRETDPVEKIPLQIRALIANRAGADLFVSLHFNSLYPDMRTKGIEVYTFPPVGQRTSSERVGAEAEPSPVNRFDAWSVVLAHAVHREVRAAMHTDDRGKKIKHLGVLRPLDCPGILVEGGFLSNPGEARRIESSAYQEQLAAAVDAGIVAYARLVASLQPAPARAPQAPSSPH